MNRTLLGDPQAVAANLASIRNVAPADGGANGETLQHALGLAVEDREAPHRAITLGDYEALALNVPGLNIARAIARASYAPGFDCWEAPGFVTVTVVPNSPGKTPRPSSATLAAIRSYLDRRRLVGTRVEVVAPNYVEVVVQVKVKALAGKSRTALAKEISDRLYRFLNPLTGGPEGGGWPLGRSVYPAEALQVIDETAGVDYAFELLLARNGCPASCGALHMPPNGLPAAGAHRIEVM
jgi:predicted phage baseplate assembly protein